MDVAANNLAFFLAEYDPTPQNLARAQKLIDPLLDRHKGVPQVVDTGAWVYYRLGKFDKARELLAAIEKVVARPPHRGGGQKLEHAIAASCQVIVHHVGVRPLFGNVVNVAQYPQMAGAERGPS